MDPVARKTRPLRGGLDSTGLHASDLDRRTSHLDVLTIGRPRRSESSAGAGRLIEYTLTTIGFAFAAAMLIRAVRTAFFGARR